jgi:kinesin family member 5
MRQIIAKLDAIESDPGAPSLTTEDVTQLRRQLAEGQSLVRETVDRLRQKQEESDLLTRRKDELESRLGTLETEYEELLGARGRLFRSVHATNSSKEKIIHDEEASSADISRSTAELKVRLPHWLITTQIYRIPSQNKLEAQYAAKRDAHQSEIADLRQQLEMKGNEVRTLNVSIDSLKSLNEELKVDF